LKPFGQKKLTLGMMKKDENSSSLSNTLPPKQSKRLTFGIGDGLRNNLNRRGTMGPEKVL
jgi:hypothetical protein